MWQSPARPVRAAMARLRPVAFFVRRAWIAIASPGVRLEGKRQGIASGVRLRATDGGSIAIGSGCDLSRGIEIVAQGGHVRLGRRVFVGPWTTIASKEHVWIGDDCMIAERVSIRDQDHAVHGTRDLPIRSAGFDTASIEIGEGAWIGAGAVVLKGVRIGRGAVVAANAVVTRDVEAFEIVGGVPARRIGTRALADG